MFPNTSLWNIDISNNKSLPEGLYAFLEFYCGNPECDCNAGSYHMVEINPQGQILGNIIAEIHYEWEIPGSAQRIYLEDEALPSRLTKAALDIFQNIVNSEPEQVEVLKTHYTMIKDYFKQNPDKFEFVSEVNANNKIRRNEPCPCGSGKKFKKCCL